MSRAAAPLPLSAPAPIRDTLEHGPFRRNHLNGVTVLQFQAFGA